ncbi:hypothetical protein [Crocinitomix catalasitica]|uniref:hypothetical protein n=1 Tax=Crocinitomix catalasitica TaxID=184607 RepID=UPI00048140FF|nr:hypothetical protein [Crocinitomix catalasitica]
MNYNDKKFRPVVQSDNGEITADTIFHYQQKGNILTCNYSGTNILSGQLMGIVDEAGNIDMRYQQINNKGELMTGKCRSTPKINAAGKLTLIENWQWTSGDLSEGNSVLEEV